MSIASTSPDSSMSPSCVFLWHSSLQGRKQFVRNSAKVTPGAATSLLWKANCKLVGPIYTTVQWERCVLKVALSIEEHDTWLARTRCRAPQWTVPPLLQRYLAFQVSWLPGLPGVWLPEILHDNNHLAFQVSCFSMERSSSAPLRSRISGVPGIKVTLYPGTLVTRISA